MRADYLRQLDLASVELEEQEAAFLEDNVEKTVFTFRERKFIDSLTDRYSQFLR